MDIDAFTQALSPDIIERFRNAIETGKWPDGRALTKEQRATCMQAVIAYEHHHLDETQRTGYVPPKDSACAPEDNASEKDSEKALKWTS